MEEANNNAGESQEVDKKVPIRALSRKTRNEISALLNPVKILPTDHGRNKGQELDRYWPGLAHLCEIEGKFKGEIERDPDPCGKILKLWGEKDLENNTVEKFLEFLEEIDRFDVIDDISEKIKEDIRLYLKSPSPHQYVNLENDKDILTTDDVNRIEAGEGPQMYDAFVLFVDDDIDFATELINTMEKQYGMKFFVKERDLIGGRFEYEAMTTLITERCTRLIVVLSQAFFESPAAEFFLQFAQSVGIENSQRKVIPCVYKPCKPLPKYMSCYFLLDYTRAGQLWNYWDKLRDSIRAPAPDKLWRSRSENTPVTRRNDNNHLRPILHQNNEPKPLNHIVQFNSMVNLNTAQSDKIMTDNTLSASTSANSLDMNQKHKKKAWFQWLRPKNHAKYVNQTENAATVNNHVKEKKKLSMKLSMKRKRTALVAN